MPRVDQPDQVDQTMAMYASFSSGCKVKLL